MPSSMDRTGKKHGSHDEVERPAASHGVPACWIGGAGRTAGRIASVVALAPLFVALTLVYFFCIDLSRNLVNESEPLCFQFGGL